MTTITNFDRRNLKNLRKDIDAALSNVASKYGIKLEAGSARFSDTNVTFKLEASTISSKGNVETKGAVALKTFYPQFVGLKVTLNNGHRGTVIEYHSRKHKYPFIVKIGSKRFKVPESLVQRSVDKGV